MTIVVNWENKLVFCATNVGLSVYYGCFSTLLHNGFLIALIICSVTLLSSCEIDSFLTLISNKFIRRYLTGVRNPCIGCKDCAPVSVGFYSSTRIFGQD